MENSDNSDSLREANEAIEKWRDFDMDGKRILLDKNVRI
jgi:hypothetical protein